MFIFDYIYNECLIIQYWIKVKESILIIVKQLEKYSIIKNDTNLEYIFE